VAVLADLPAGRQARETLIMYYIYAIRSLSKCYLYVGITNNFDNRIKRHNNGWEKTTRAYKPFKLVFLTTTENRNNATSIEIYLKSGMGKEFLQSLIKK